MPKDFKKSKDTPKKKFPPPAKIPLHRPKANSVRFEDPYDHIHHINNHN